MKKIYYCLFAICSFFIFSFSLKANTMLFIDNSSENEIFSKRSDSRFNTSFLGFNIYQNNSSMFGNTNSYVYMNTFYDFYNFNNSSLIYSDSLKFLFDNSLSLYNTLISLLPSQAVIKDYYTISYLRGTKDNGVYLFLIFYDSPIVFNDFDSIKDFSYYDPSINNNYTFVYRFKVSSDSFIYIDYSSILYKDILNDVVFRKYKDSSFSGIITYSNDGYYISPSFYNFFFDSNFNIIFNIDSTNSVNPLYIVNRVKNSSGFDLLDGNTYKTYSLNYFKTYSFLGGTTGIQSFNNIIHYKERLKPPFSGGYGVVTFSYYLRKNVLKFNSSNKSSVIYYQGSIIVSYMENDVLSLNRSTIALNCDKTGNDLCKFNLDFSGLNNPSVVLYYDSNILSEFFNFYYSSYPSVWYKLNDFDLYTMNLNDESDLICYNCEFDENGNLPSINLPNSILNSFLDSIDIDFSNNTSSLSSLFSSSFSVIKSIVNSSIEILSLVSDFFFSLPVLVQFFVLVLFIISMIFIFIKFIS